MTSFGRCFFPTDLWGIADGERRHPLIISFRERQKEGSCLIFQQPPVTTLSAAQPCDCISKHSKLLIIWQAPKKMMWVEERSKWSCLKCTILRWWRRIKPSSPTVLWSLVLCTANKSQHWLSVACWCIFTCAEIRFSVKMKQKNLL